MAGTAWAQPARARAHDVAVDGEPGIHIDFRSVASDGQYIVEGVTFTTIIAKVVGVCLDRMNGSLAEQTFPMT